MRREQRGYRRRHYLQKSGVDQGESLTGLNLARLHTENAVRPMEFLEILCRLGGTRVSDQDVEKRVEDEQRIEGSTSLGHRASEPKYSMMMACLLFLLEREAFPGLSRTTNNSMRTNEPAKRR